MEDCTEPGCLGSSHFLEPRFHQTEPVLLPQPLRGSVSSPVRWANHLTEDGSCTGACKIRTATTPKDGCEDHKRQVEGKGPLAPGST